jgi:hypothetical protein
MTKKLRTLDWAAVIFLNIALTILSVGLQFLMYGFAPAAFNPDTAFKGIGEKEAACIQAAKELNTTLYIELLFGSLLIFLFSRKFLQSKTDRRNLISFLNLLIYLAVCILTMKCFSDAYIRHCTGVSKAVASVISCSLC